MHRLTAAIPYGPGLRGTRLSNSVEALLSASRPVTTLRMSDAMAVEQVSRIATSEQSVLCSIDASRLHSTQGTFRATKDQHCSTRQRGAPVPSMARQLAPDVPAVPVGSLKPDALCAFSEQCGTFRFKPHR